MRRPTELDMKGMMNALLTVPVRPVGSIYIYIYLYMTDKSSLLM